MTQPAGRGSFQRGGPGMGIRVLVVSIQISVRTNLDPRQGQHGNLMILPVPQKQRIPMVWQQRELQPPQAEQAAGQMHVNPAEPENRTV